MVLRARAPIVRRAMLAGSRVTASSSPVSGDPRFSETRGTFRLFVDFPE
jgi:hypothetical protein